MMCYDHTNPVRNKVLDGEVVGWVKCAQRPYKTWWLKVSFPEDNTPNELFKRLEAIGFKRDEGMFPLPAFEGIQTYDFSKTGSAIFGGWTEQEGKTFMRQLNKIFKDVGYNPPDKYKMTTADMM